jgi:triosephosphate isomerase (TIM)
MRRKLMAANWKMNLSLPEAEALARELKTKIGAVTKTDVVIAPNFTVLHSVGEIIKGSSIKLAAQNVAAEMKGAYTGETSVSMITAVGAQYVILGHSERRHIFGESDEFINKKVILACANGLMPIFCVGETLKERESGNATGVVERQVEQGLLGVSGKDMARIVIAYEPVWAIGTGVNATPDQAQEMHKFIRDRIESKYDKTVAISQIIVYGGSVTHDNIDALMSMPDLDGALVGGASLKVDSFERIVNFK